ncbi:putative necrosis-inducing factor-domain-containing protein [Lasiosphaeria hispida]|uniref:Necrosis-inducing factor-domain-containing protein n=1 Tax=Lasiosphaeria hispida TaxID=260671 RepID=A0AAJ0H9G7_9PEZI|nr:putative necrosis-inducing factor-domain-containing protein [Lasiosphaeria hispida]
MMIFSKNLAVFLAAITFAALPIFVDAAATFVPSGDSGRNMAEFVNELLNAGTATHGCTDPTFDDETTTASPTVADCTKIITNIADDGTWTFEAGVQHQLVQFGTCAFGVEVQDTPMGTLVMMGNNDIIKAIWGSITRFTLNGLVGAAGITGCPEFAMTDMARVKWGLYHT